ncbi:MAG TPA: LamG-like jellyroll fold domain-containing protein, partial [Verrucomicrobiae bacterium]|nr:LamG-like jellyroll fold domain-containing protein [Verrucomicrobiae bacterium]
AIVAQQTLGTYTPRTAGRNLYIGRRVAPAGDSTTALVGSLDEVSLYSRALTPTEIATIYNAGTTGKTVLMPTLPSIIAQPISQSAGIGSNVTFSVTVTGSSPLTYQWQDGATNIFGATNTTLVLSNVQLVDAGAYSVVVTNLYGSVNSSNAVLTVTNSVTPPATNGLISWWPGEGNANDVVGPNNGTLEGGLGFGTGEVGQAFNFTGNNMDVRVPTNSSLDVGSGPGFTVECWINPSSDSLNNNIPIVEWNDDTYWGVHFAIDNNGGAGDLYANVVDDGGGWHFINSGGGVLMSNVWQHVALTYDKASGVATLYDNGAIVAQQTLGTYTPRTAGRNLYIGRRVAPAGDSANSFNGLIDEVSLYGRALTSTEVASIYNAGAAGKTALPVLLAKKPMLSISVSGSNLVLKWPLWASDYNLQSAGMGTPPMTWSNVTTPPQTNGTSVQVQMPLTSARKLFRLQRP